MGGGNTVVFVRNLPYSTTDASLTEAFSNEFGPVKEAFIVAERGPGGKSKGYGFVYFALAEDAASAVAKSKSFKVDGRAVTIDTANRKAPVIKGFEGKSSGGGGDGETAHEQASRKALAILRGEDPGDSDSDAPKAEFKLTGPVSGDFLAKPRPARRSAPASHPALARSPRGRGRVPSRVARNRGPPRVFLSFRDAFGAALPPCPPPSP